jgi:hypothetical protein
MAGSGPQSDDTPDPVAQARALSSALQDFHRALIRAEIGSDPALENNPYTMLFALIDHPSYAWMGALSRLIARIDQHVADGEAGAPGLVPALYAEAAALLAGTGSPAAEEFRMRHLMALQKEPDVGLATGRLRRALASGPATGR